MAGAEQPAPGYSTMSVRDGPNNQVVDDR